MARGDLRVNDRLVVPAAELDLRYVRASGPGGQNVNKVASKAVVRFDLAHSSAVPDDLKARALARLRSKLTQAGALIVTNGSTRDQGRNREAALTRLAALLASAVARPRPRRPTTPSPAAIERRLAGKQRRARLKRARRIPAAD
ncbi:MAG: aminoacyl-tRNA hydrolase [Deltaproteobacteria bacterium]|nr:aminoacyl-tRNA hydrolase [Deltaproteobacteria bacterium]